MTQVDGKTIRKVLLEVVESFKNKGPGMFQQGAVLEGVAQKLQLEDIDSQQALLTIWSDLFRVGYLAWGYDLQNSSPPFIHVTERGRTALAHFSRDPFNPEGYLSYLKFNSTINPVTESYVKEALATFNAGCYKSSAVMIGCATESIIMQLRETVLTKIKANGNTPTANLSDWKVKTVIDSLDDEFTKRLTAFPRDLREIYESNWSVFISQIRRSRNDAGHPTSLDPVNEDIVHSSLLIFPELIKLIFLLEDWVHKNWK